MVVMSVVMSVGLAVGVASSHALEIELHAAVSADLRVVTGTIAFSEPVTLIDPLVRQAKPGQSREM